MLTHTKTHPICPQPAARGQPLITLTRVNKSYATPSGPFSALEDISFEVGQGEFVAIVGKSGSGKSTLINTIFASHLIDSKGRMRPEEPVRSTTEIQTVSHIIEENGVRLRLNIVDTPGYGDQVNNDRWSVTWGLLV